MSLNSIRKEGSKFIDNIVLLSGIKERTDCRQAI